MLEKPLDSYPKRLRFTLPAWLRLDLPGAPPWPDRWLPADQEGAALTRGWHSLSRLGKLAAIPHARHRGRGLNR